MKKRLPLLCFLAAALFCTPVAQAQLRPTAKPQQKSATPGATEFQKGVVLVKFSKEYEAYLATQGQHPSGFGIRKLDSLLQKMQVKGIRQEFAILFNPAFNQRSADNANRGYAAKKGNRLTAAELERRHREFGFHLWYKLQFDSTVYLKGILTGLQSLKEIVEAAELVPIGRLASVFNDPLYFQQANLHNTGQHGGIPGRDIHIEEAWNITTGDSNVVVAVSESGVFLGHEDMQGSMWWGKGYNFFDDTPELTPDGHATAAASVIGARTNNGKGISGVAGGDGTPASGVRIMSTQILDPDWNIITPSLVAGFVFAADNGAAINNNSWWYYTTVYYHSEYLYTDAVRYFTKYGGGAGTKGGLTVCSAGNENLPFQAASSSYDVDNKIVVGAVNFRDRKSGFSNYGEWIDICAPTGERDLNGYPLGFPVAVVGFDANGNPISEYGPGGGTSMAAPIVSGVAALVASVAPGRFTADEVVGIILSTADNVDSLNPGYEGKLGAGRVNAYKAVLKAQQMAALPVLDTVSNITVNRSCNGYQINYTKNAANNEVMIAVGLTRKFDLPHGRVYNVGDSIGKTAKVIYKGPASSFVMGQILKDSARHYFKLWSVSGSNYSGGTVVRADSSFYTLRSPSAVQGASDVAINFGKTCPNSDVLVVVNSLPQFGVPRGNLSAGSLIEGGGTVLYKGSAAGFTHGGLASGNYYYALYPVVGANYAQPKVLGGFCFGTQGVALPVKANFEAPGIPQHFAIFTPAQDSLGWQTAQNMVGHSGRGVAYTRNFHNYLPEKMNDASYLQTAPLNLAGADSVICKFAWYYHAYDTSDTGNYYDINGALIQDTLTVLVSADCGQTWQTAWKRWGMNLATIPPDFNFVDIEIKPNSPTEWSTAKINLSNFIPPGAQSISVAFKNTNRGGNDIFLDDINIYKVVPTDAGVAAIISPDREACSTTLSPKVVLENFGLNTLTSANVNYRLDNGPLQTVNWTGSKGYEQRDTLQLPALSASIGSHRLTVSTSAPNMLADGVPSNDSATIVFNLISTSSIVQNTIYKESFENPLVLTESWRVVIPQNPNTWQRGDNRAVLTPGMVAADDSSALFVNTFSDGSIGAFHDLYTPLFSTGNADTVRLTFSRAAFAYTVPGNTTDKLEVLLTTNCGESFTTIYSKTGTDLATSDVPGQYLPLSAADWKSDTVDVSNLIRNAVNYRFVFRVINGFEANVYLDNVQVHSKQAAVVLPLNLLSFTGKAAGTGSAQLNWHTANEVNTAYFELQRGTEGRSFNTVAAVQAKGSAQATADYAHTDANLVSGKYYYRLRMVDKDGRQTFSQQVSVLIKGSEAITVYPVPAVNQVQLNSSAGLVGKNVLLTDMQGRTLNVIKITQQQQALNIATLAAGTYLLKLPDATAVKLIKL